MRYYWDLRSRNAILLRFEEMSFDSLGAYITCLLIVPIHVWGVVRLNNTHIFIDVLMQ